MSRTGTGRRYRTAETINSKTPLDGKTPAQRAILYYLQVRAMEKRGGATQAEMTDDTGMAERSVGAAVRILARTGEIV